MASFPMNRAALGLLALLGFSGCTDSGEFDDAFSGVYFVQLEADPAEVASLASQISNELNLDLLHVYDAASEGFSVRLPHLLVPELEKVEGVKLVLEDERQDYSPIPDPDADFQYGDDEVPEGIIRIGGPYNGSSLSGIHVAIIDTGIDGAHPDLNVVAVRDVVGDSTPNDANDGDPNGHGTHVAGTVGALANGSGVAGVAPGVSLHAVRVLGTTGSGYYSDIIAGIEYVLENPEIRVVNMSLGGPKSSSTQPLRDAVQRLVDAGVIVVIAAGNESQDTSNVAPAGYDAGVIVSAYDVGNKEFAWFSNFGDEVDIAAPGVSIYSTWPGGGYESLDGTSMAAPHVAGAAALFVAQNNNANNATFLDAVVSGGENGYKGQNNSHPEPFLDLDGLLD